MTEYPQPPRRPNATDDDLAQDLIENRRLSLFEVFRVTLQRSGGQMIVRGKTFRNCTLEGPCVLLTTGGSAIENCMLGDALGDMRNLMLVPAGDKVIGALVYDQCRFENCHFSNVGFTGSAEFLNSLLQSALDGETRGSAQ
jgi:hypothetical protein